MGEGSLFMALFISTEYSYGVLTRAAFRLVFPGFVLVCRASGERPSEVK